MEGDKFIDRNLISILSIDGGGGIRGIVLAFILNFLERELQKLDGPNARIADYFNTISGTDAGGLMAAMLACPNSCGRPLYTANDIINIYLNYFTSVFCPPRSHVWKLPYLERVITFFLGRNHNDGWCPNESIRELLGEKRLHDTLTDVVIVDYDNISDDLVVFSNQEIKELPSRDALLSDICIGGMATPAYLPSHYFETIEHSGKITKFNLGGLIADDSSFMAIRETVRKVTGGVDDLGEARKHGQFLLLSIGTGMRIDRLDTALLCLIKTLGTEDCFLQIQDDTSRRDIPTMDEITRENLYDLLKVGEYLLRKPVFKRNPITGILEGETHAGALVRFAKLLSEDKKRRGMSSFQEEPCQTAF
ncbi:hypothetical protein BT93_F0930 [Corymbia citriodora subsp. variegata]|nr:hypothetical protein BT93_F0930 [Corymbia citriodora subsp. variegata]